MEGGGPGGALGWRDISVYGVSGLYGINRAFSNSIKVEVSFCTVRGASSVASICFTWVFEELLQEKFCVYLQG